MPLSIRIPEKELYDPATKKFITVKATELTLEHSLLSISKWEEKWHKPYLTPEKKTYEEFIDYLKCMCLTRNVDPNVFYALDQETAQQIADYIADSHTATTIKRKDKKGSKKIITNELIYFWMANYGIPFDPCQKWHLNRLLTLVKVCSIKNSPPKKMSKKEISNRNRALNASRRKALGTKG